MEPIDRHQPPDEAIHNREAEILAAEHALGNGDFDAARGHLLDAERQGTSRSEIRALRAAINREERSVGAHSKHGLWSGIAVGTVGYVILSFRQPPDWTIPIWALAAFGLVPAVAGFVSGRAQGPTSAARRRFHTGMAATATPMYFYTLISLIVLRGRIHSTFDSGQMLLLMTVIPFLYAAMAGAVAGLAARLSWFPGHRMVRRAQ